MQDGHWLTKTCFSFHVTNVWGGGVEHLHPTSGTQCKRILPFGLAVFQIEITTSRRRNRQGRQSLVWPKRLQVCRRHMQPLRKDEPEGAKRQDVHIRIDGKTCLAAFKWLIASLSCTLSPWSLTTISTLSSSTCSSLPGSPVRGWAPDPGLNCPMNDLRRSPGRN
jgi:hypothetical protein